MVYQLFKRDSSFIDLLEIQAIILAEGLSMDIPIPLTLFDRRYLIERGV